MVRCERPLWWDMRQLQWWDLRDSTHTSSVLSFVKFIVRHCYRPISEMCKSYGRLVCYSWKWIGELRTVCHFGGPCTVNVKKNGREKKCFVDVSHAVAIAVDVSCCSVWWSWFENCQFLFWVKDVYHITFNFICDSSCFFWKNCISLQDCYWLENVSVALFLSYHTSWMTLL